MNSNGVFTNAVKLMCFKFSSAAGITWIAIMQLVSHKKVPPYDMGDTGSVPGGRGGPKCYNADVTAPARFKKFLI